MAVLCNYGGTFFTFETVVVFTLAIYILRSFSDYAFIRMPCFKPIY